MQNRFNRADEKTHQSYRWASPDHYYYMSKLCVLPNSRWQFLKVALLVVCGIEAWPMAMVY